MTERTDLPDGEYLVKDGKLYRRVDEAPVKSARFVPPLNPYVDPYNGPGIPYHPNPRDVWCGEGANGTDVIICGKIASSSSIELS